MGFTLTEIESLLSLRTRRSCRATRELAAMKLQLIDARIRERRRLRRELTGLVADCDANAEDSTCPVIERLGAQSHQQSSERQPPELVPRVPTGCLLFDAR